MSLLTIAVSSPASELPLDFAEGVPRLFKGRSVLELCQFEPVPFVEEIGPGRQDLADLDVRRTEILEQHP